MLDGSTGVLVYTSNQDFNGIDYLEVNATDAGVSTTLKVAVTIFSVNDPPIITDKSSLSSQTQQLNENISNIIDLNVTDPNDSPASVNFSWSLSAKDSNVSHTDWNYFTINPSTGELSFTSPPNYEVDNSILGTNIYEFVASVSDNQGGVETDSVSLRVQVMPVNESPSFSKSIEVLTTLEDASVEKDEIEKIIQIDKQIIRAWKLSFAKKVYPYYPKRFRKMLLTFDWDGALRPLDNIYYNKPESKDKGGQTHEQD